MSSPSAMTSPEVDARLELDPLVRRDRHIALSHCPLHFHPAADRIHYAREFREHSVVGVLDDAAAMLRDFRVDQFPQMRPQPRVGAFLISAHQP